jgi:predicted metal-dependent enzyme (double-stranded beta helix superfamily)
MTIRAERDRAVAAAIGRIRTIDQTSGDPREALHEIKGVLLELAAHTELFPLEAFPADVGNGNSTIYRLSEDPDHTYALYASAALPGKSVAPHNHTTWAVIAGVHGDEHNVFYERQDDGDVPGKAELRKSGAITVSPGKGVTLMPDEIHSIHVTGDQPTVHLHMYGLALDRLHHRVMFNMEEGTCKVFSASQNIRPA